MSRYTPLEAYTRWAVAHGTAPAEAIDSVSPPSPVVYSPEAAAWSRHIADDELADYTWDPVGALALRAQARYWRRVRLARALGVLVGLVAAAFALVVPMSAPALWLPALIVAATAFALALVWEA